MSRALRAIVVSSIAMTVFSACSGDDDGRPTSTPTATVAAPSTATATAPPPATATAPAATSTVAPSATRTSPPAPTQTPTVAPSDTATPEPTATSVPETCDDPDVRASEPLCELDFATVRCDFLVAAKCVLPYPSSYFLDADANTPTGFRLAYGAESLPANAAGTHVDPTEWNTLDGFSPGPMIEAFFPAGVDLGASDVPPITTVEEALEADSPTVLLDAETGERVVHFAELDQQAGDPSEQMFIIRPAVRLKNAHRYIVAIRGLVDRTGAPIEPERPFEILRDGLATPVRVINERRAHFEDIFAILADAGVERAGLQLAWDFVTASSEALTGRALSMRDQALAQIGAGAPAFTVTSVEENVNENTARRIRGTYTVPRFVLSDTPPTRLNLDGNGTPLQNGTTTAPFLVNIPRSAVADGVAHPARPFVYGHGLLGSREEVNAGHLQAFDNRFNFIAAGTDWIGMSENDRIPIFGFIGELSGFPALPDRLHQAFLNFVLLGRLMIAENGFVSHPAFQLDGAPLIDRQELYYYGISQGGIEGGAYLALSPDTTRGVLGVNAANYSFLLQRSIDFTAFQVLLDPSYPSPLDRQILLGVIQQLWDRAEPQGYLPHLVENPLPGTPAKKILMQIGIHDSQVSYIASGIQARSLGIPNLAPSVYPLFGVEVMTAPFDGSAFVPYDVNGTETPLTNTPPESDNGVHEAVRRLDAAQRQIDAFLRPDGRIENFCPGPCFFTGVPDVDER